MATLPTSVKVNRQDLQNAEPWIFPLVSIYNTFNQAIYDALNGQVTFGENIRCQIKEFTFRTSAAYSSGDFTAIRFTADFKAKVMGLSLMQILETDTGAPILDPVFVNWYYANGDVVIPWITGLTDATEYFIRLKAE